MVFYVFVIVVLKMKKPYIYLLLLFILVIGIVNSAVDERQYVYNGSHWIPWLSTPDGKPKVDINLVNITANSMIINGNITGGNFIYQNGISVNDTIKGIGYLQNGTDADFPNVNISSTLKVNKITNIHTGTSLDITNAVFSGGILTTGDVYDPLGASSLGQGDVPFVNLYLSGNLDDDGGNVLTIAQAKAAYDYSLLTNSVLNKTDGAYEIYADKIGIGTDTPVSTLQVAGNLTVDDNLGVGTAPERLWYGTDNYIKLEGTSNPALIIDDTGQARSYQFVAESNELNLRYGSTPIITVENTGEVGIGTVNPNSTLQVIGPIGLKHNANISNKNAGRVTICDKNPTTFETVCLEIGMDGGIGGRFGPELKGTSTATGSNIIYFGGAVRFLDDQTMGFGSSNDNTIDFSTEGNDYLAIQQVIRKSSSYSGWLMLEDLLDNPSNPLWPIMNDSSLGVHASNKELLDFIGIGHDNKTGIVQAWSGNLTLKSEDYIKTNKPLIVEGNLNVKGNINATGCICYDAGIGQTCLGTCV